ncbi:unnamed protein product [Symbiodinium sp. CCMP2592]|nr:unnamed protein product [Symbiodinium sp. CCMP2592]
MEGAPKRVAKVVPPRWPAQHKAASSGSIQAPAEEGQTAAQQLRQPKVVQPKAAVPKPRTEAEENYDNFLGGGDGQGDAFLPGDLSPDVLTNMFGTCWEAKSGKYNFSKIRREMKYLLSEREKDYKQAFLVRCQAKDAQLEAERAEHRREMGEKDKEISQLKQLVNAWRDTKLSDLQDWVEHRTQEELLPLMTMDVTKELPPWKREREQLARSSAPSPRAPSSLPAVKTLPPAPTSPAATASETDVTEGETDLEAVAAAKRPRRA